jgi:hypothetical protein
MNPRRKRNPRKKPVLLYIAPDIGEDAGQILVMG